MPIYSITPNDVLFFRDARPFEAGGGHGARWPDPSIWFSALHAAFHRAYPTPADWEHPHRRGKSGRYDDERRDQRFGSLQTVGPFPCRDRDWHFPCPEDVTAVDRVSGRLSLLSPIDGDGGRSDLPPPLTHTLGNTAPPSKDSRPPVWWSKPAIEAYLRGAPIDVAHTLDNSEALYDAEWMTGIGIDPQTRAQDKDHLYSAEYLRLKPGVAMGASAAMPLKRCPDRDGLDLLFEGNGLVIVGGQQRVCRVTKASETGLERFLPVGPPIDGSCVKWLLLTPAVYPAIAADANAGITAHPGGWLPNWIDPASGRVLLRRGETDRRAGETRVDWRHRVRALSPLDCRLVAARVPKPLILNGWSDRIHLYDNGKDDNGRAAHGPTATMLAVPAGAAYYFDGPDAPQLADTLNWHGLNRKEASPASVRRRSTLFGEQGFGIGVCGAWRHERDRSNDRRK